MYNFIYRDDFIYKDVTGMGEKKKEKETKEKNPRLVALPSPLYTVISKRRELHQKSSRYS